MTPTTFTVTNFDGSEAFQYPTYEKAFSAAVRRATVNGVAMISYADQRFCIYPNGGMS